MYWNIYQNSSSQVDSVVHRNFPPSFYRINHYWFKQRSMAIALNTYGIIELINDPGLSKMYNTMLGCSSMLFSSGAICKRGVPTYDKKGSQTICPHSKKCQKVRVAFQTCKSPWHLHPRTGSTTFYCCSTKLEKCLLKRFIFV